MRPLQSKAFTLVEIMVGLLIVTIALVTFSSVFTTISKAILVNKTKTIAANLAQEKIESLKNLSYYRLLVSTADGFWDSNFPNMRYDLGTTQSYYPEETLNVGGLQFKRRALVQFVRQNGSDLEPRPWTDNDTGIKLVTVYVVWKESDQWKELELRNLRNNPDRAQLEFSFTGTVSSGATGNALVNALVETQQNPSYFARTDASGNYSFKVSPGTYTLRASAPGYFAAISTSYAVAVDQTGSYAQNFALSLMAQGTATGYAYIRDHLVITQVVSATTPAGALMAGEHEWVELYNPTTYNILVASRTSSTDAWSVFFVTVTWIDNPNNEPAGGSNSKYLVGMPGITGSVFTAFRSTSINWTANTTTISIPSNSYFLIANKSTITFATPSGNVYRTADAYYRGTQDCGVDCTQIDNSNAGGIRVTGAGGLSYYNGALSWSDWHDGIAWSGSVSAPTRAREGSDGYNTGGFGLPPSAVMLRMAFKSNDADSSMTLTTDRRNSVSWAANCFDRNTNGLLASSGGEWDMILLVTLCTTSSGTLNSDFRMPPYSGTPAAGALVSSNDGLSSVAFVQAYGSFTVTNLATGTWTVTVSSGNYTRDISSVTITPSITTGVPNGITGPKWEFSGFPSVPLTTTTIYGYASGVVRDANGAALSGVSVTASGAANSPTTDSNGRYRLTLLPASGISVLFSKNGYSTERTDNLNILVGVDISTVDKTLIAAGGVNGFITTNGTPSGALPGVPIVVTDLSSTTIKGSAISGLLGSTGNFTVPSVETGTWIVTPQLETGETSTPANAIITVTTNSVGTWSSTFTITNAFGKITGVVGVTSSTSPITTGVLLVASTQQITAESAPIVNSDLRTGSTIYYAASSDAAGNYSISLRGNASYYLYGWYPQTLDVSVSSAPKRKSPGTVYVGPGATATRDITW